MNKLFFVFILLAFTLPSLSQKLTGTSEKFSGFPYPGIATRGNFNYSFKKSIIYIGQEEAIFTVSSSKKDDESVVKMNASMNVIWQTPIQDKILFISRLKNKILVISTPDWKKSHNKLIRKINAAILDPSTGKVVGEKLIFENSSHFYIDPDFMSDENNYFQGLLIRHTNAKRVSYTYKGDVKKGSTNQLDIISIDEGLAVQIRTLTTRLGDEDMAYIGCAMNKKEEIFIVGYSNNILIAEKYAANGVAPIAELSVIYEARRVSRKYGILNINESGDFLAVAVEYRNPKDDHSIITALFNFAEKKSYQQDEQFTKAHQRELKMSYLNDLEVSSVQFYGDKIIVSKETQPFESPRTPGGTLRYESYQIIVSVYDKQLKLLKNLYLGRYYQSFLPEHKFAGYAINGHLLHVLFSDVAGPEQYKTVFAEIDLVSPDIIRQNVVLERGDGDKRAIIEPAACLWFDKILILPYSILNGTGKEDAIFQKIILN